MLLCAFRSRTQLSSIESLGLETGLRITLKSQRWTPTTVSKTQIVKYPPHPIKIKCLNRFRPVLSGPLSGHPTKSTYPRSKGIYKVEYPPQYLSNLHLTMRETPPASCSPSAATSKEDSCYPCSSALLTPTTLVNHDNSWITLNRLNCFFLSCLDFHLATHWFLVRSVELVSCCCHGCCFSVFMHTVNFPSTLLFHPIHVHARLRSICAVKSLHLHRSSIDRLTGGETLVHSFVHSIMSAQQFNSCDDCRWQAVTAR
eukprot:765261-Hanusia_phi.AAC.3